MCTSTFSYWVNILFRIGHQSKADRQINSHCHIQGWHTKPQNAMRKFVMGKNRDFPIWGFPPPVSSFLIQFVPIEANLCGRWRFKLYPCNLVFTLLSGRGMMGRSRIPPPTPSLFVPFRLRSDSS